MKRKLDQLIDSPESLSPLRDDSLTYDALLSSLKSSSTAFADAYKKRERQEQGFSSSDEEEEEDDDDDDDDDDGEEVDDDGDDLSEDDSMKSEDQDDEENDEAEKNLEEDASQVSEVNESEDDEDELYEDDEEKEDNESSKNSCSFHLHTTHTLSETEIQKLKGGKRKYKAELTAIGMLSCKWMTTNFSCIKDECTLQNFGIKSHLEKHWLTIHKNKVAGDFVSAQQRQFFSLCNSYQDILHSNKDSNLTGGLQDDSGINNAYLLHILNHVYRTRDLVMKNNAKLKQQLEHKNKWQDTAELPRDQGFTRPKVLILLPLRSIALKIVQSLINLIPPSYKVNVEQMEKFLTEFGTDDDADQPSSKPADHQALFGGNNDDHFRMGIKFTKKSVKLYSDFYLSDIIIASPIGLITKIGEAESEKDKDVDFLSSIEILVIDYSDVILMQNWSHVISIVDELNKIPTKQHGADFMRIREWYLNDQARYFRQTIILSNFLTAELNALFNRSCQNYQGKVKLASIFNGVLPKVLLQVRQVYERFDCDCIADVDDKRFEFFVKKIFPKIKDPLQGGIMIFASSYFEYVRLRNYLKSQSCSFCLLGEYTKQSDISRARTWFFHGSRKIMLYTERAHFYHRYKIRGIHEIFFYSLPERSSFYAEITNMFERSDNPTCTVLFSHFDNLRLERIVGSSSAKRMLNSSKRTFMFC